jgi:hypothetical protein
MLRAREASESCRGAGVRVLLQSVPAKESTGQGKKRLMDVGPLFIAERAVGETDSTKRRFVPLPTAIEPARCHAWYYASRAKARCRAHAYLAGLAPRHNRGRLERNQDDGVDGLALPVTVGWHQRARALAANRYDWLR